MYRNAVTNRSRLRLYMSSLRLNAKFYGVHDHHDRITHYMRGPHLHAG